MSSGFLAPDSELFPNSTATLHEPAPNSFRTLSRPRELGGEGRGSREALEGGGMRGHAGCVRSIWIVVVLLAAGCGGGFSLSHTLEYPPRLGVRVFPRVWIDGGVDRFARAVAASVSQHLAESSPTVIVMTPEGVGPSGAILEVRARVRERWQPMFFDPGPTRCTPYGCTAMRSPLVNRATVVDAEIRLKLIDAQTHSLIQEWSQNQTTTHSDPFSAPFEVERRLSASAIRAIDPQRETQSIEFIESADPEVRDTLEHVRNRRLDIARTRFESVIDRRDFATRSDRLRVTLLYDLGQTLRALAALVRSSFAERANRLIEAHAILERAMREDPQPRIGHALADLDEQRNALTAMAAYREMLRRNFDLEDDARDLAEIPEPPASYRDAR